MARTEQLKLAYSQAESRRNKIADQHAFVLEFDEQIELALKQYELLLKDGQDAHKVLAEEITDDEEHPVATTTVYDWIARRNGRRPPGELIAKLYEAIPSFAAWWNNRLGYTVPDKLTQIPWEQERALYRKALAEFGAAGEQKLRAIAVTKPDPAGGAK